MQELQYSLDRTVLIHANPETVFRYFTDNARWAKWWGEGSTIDPQPGGKVYIRHPGGTETVGEVLDVAPPERIVFTYGYASGTPIPPGSSRVTIRLEPDSSGTRLHLRHEFDESSSRDLHIQGWRFQLSVFANVVANEVHADAAVSVDAWFSAWAITDDKARENALASLVGPDIRFRDRYSLLDGLEDLTAHIGAGQRFMPGMTLCRKGEIRHCQGTVLAEWVVVGSDGKECLSGASVFVLAPDGRLNSVTSFS